MLIKCDTYKCVKLKDLAIFKKKSIYINSVQAQCSANCFSTKINLCIINIFIWVSI